MVKMHFLKGRMQSHNEDFKCHGGNAGTHSGFHLVVPHAAFGVKVVKESFQVDPLHFQACLIDPKAESNLVRFCLNHRKMCFSLLSKYLISVTELIPTKCCLNVVKILHVDCLLLTFALAYGSLS